MRQKSIKTYFSLPVVAFLIAAIFSVFTANSSSTLKSNNPFFQDTSIAYASSLINSKEYSTFFSDKSKSIATPYRLEEHIDISMALSAFYQVEFVVLGESGKEFGEEKENNGVRRVYEIKVDNPFHFKLHLSNLYKYKDSNPALAQYYGDIWQNLREGATTNLRFNDSEIDISDVKTNAGNAISDLTFLNYDVHGLSRVTGKEIAEVKNSVSDGWFNRAGIYEFEIEFGSRWNCSERDSFSGVLQHQPPQKTVFRIVKGEQVEKNILLPRDTNLAMPELFYSINLANIDREETFLNENIRHFTVNKKLTSNNMGVSITQRGFSPAFNFVNGANLMIVNPLQSRVTLSYGSNTKSHGVIYSKTNCFGIKNGTMLRLGETRYGIPAEVATNIFDEIDFNNYGTYTIEITYELQYVNIDAKQAVGEIYKCKDIYVFEYSNEGEYSIVYNLDGGTNSPNNPASYTTLDLRPVKLNDATKAGSLFGGWYDNANFFGAAVVDVDKTRKQDIVLYAKWI